MYNEKIEQAIADYIENLNDDELLTLARSCNAWDGSCDSLAWSDMGEFDELTSGMTGWEIARAVSYGDFCAGHDYFRFDAYGNLESCDYLRFDDDDKNEIWEAVLEIPYKNQDEEIQDVIDNAEEEEEEEEGDSDWL